METPVRGSSVVPFPSAHQGAAAAAASVTPFSPATGSLAAAAEPALSVRLAVYESDRSHPAVYDVSATDPAALLAELASRTVWWLSRRASPLPREAVLAVVENLVHAHFQAATVAILADGSVQVCDRGPGIPDKERALRPGFSTATPEMRRYIRGVGSGLPVACRLLESVGGRLQLDDNLAGGTVVTLWTPAAAGARLRGAARPVPGPARAGGPPPPAPAPAQGEAPARAPAQQPLFTASAGAPRLSARQLRIVEFLARNGPAGPSQVARALGLSLTTAFRELTALEGAGLAAAEPPGKRRLTAAARELFSGDGDGGGSPMPGASA
ncbi:MAG TPA: ATP-binding protein [Limnochordales bacterium]